jgi:hypothetical protein
MNNPLKVKPKAGETHFIVDNETETIVQYDSEIAAFVNCEILNEYYKKIGVKSTYRVEKI